MAVHLTEGAVGMMCRGEADENVLKPTVQVVDLKLVKTSQQQQQQQPSERYRLMISDGVMMQQGMLGTQMNHLVKDGKLQVGSIVQLNKYVCNVIQQRMIIIIIELDVIVEKCDPIGQPVAAPRPSGSTQSAPVQPGMVSGNPQSLGGSSITSGSVPGAGASVQHPRPNQLHSSPYSSNLDSGRYAATNTSSLHPKAEPSSGFPGSIALSGSYGNQNKSFQSPREVSRLPPSGYIRPPQPGYQQPPPMYSNRGPVVRNEAPPRIIPIAALNPYQGRWTIKARVTAKGDIRHFNNARGDGKVFSFDLLDADGGEIRVTCFNTVADQFYNQIEAGRVYLISKGNLKPAQKAFNHLRNDHEIWLENTSVIQPCFEDDNTIPQQQFHFRPISDVEGLENNSVVDIIGVISSISPATSIMRKNGTETQKRTLQLKDMSGRSVELTLWGNFATAEGHRLQNICDSGVFPVLAVKSGRVNDFNGKTVGTIATTQLFIEPDFQEAHRLKEWFDKEGKTTLSVSISRETSSVGRADSRKTISQIKDEKLGIEKPDWITVNATIIYIKNDNFCYTACPIIIGDRPCNKKVTNNGDGTWRCDRCDRSVDECDYRYILQFQIQDHTGVTWVTAFQECGEEIMGISAKDLHSLKYEHNDEEKASDIVRKVLFSKFLFKLKVKEETINDEQRVKSTVVKVEKVDYASESRFLLDMVNKIQAGDFGSTAVKTESSTTNPGVSGTGINDFESRQPAAAAANYYVNSSNSSREFGLPANQVGQYGNQYSGSRLPINATSSVQPSCSSCGVVGHSPMNCPSIMSGPGIGGYGSSASSGTGATASSECYKCHQIGHWARDCPGVNTSSAYRSSGITPRGYGGVSRQQVGGF